MGEAARCLDELSGKAFESLIAELLRNMHMEIVETSTGADGGVDIVARSHEPIVGGIFVVQCKRQRTAIGAPIVRDLFGVVSSRKANKGILVTTSRFTSAAVEFAKGNPIELIDGEALLQLVSAHGDDAVAAMAGSLPLPVEMRRFVDIGISGSRAAVDRIREQRDELSKGLRLIKRKDFKDFESLMDFLADNVARYGEALTIFTNQVSAFSGVDHRGAEAAARRAFARALEVIEELLALERSLYAARLPRGCESPEFRRRVKLARLADACGELVEEYKRIYSLTLAEIERALASVLEQLERVDGTVIEQCEQSGQSRLVISFTVAWPDLGDRGVVLTNEIYQLIAVADTRGLR